MHITEILNTCTVKLQWPEHLWNFENIFETNVVRAKRTTLNYPKSIARVFLKGTQEALVNEPSVFEPLKLYCI